MKCPFVSESFAFAKYYLQLKYVLERMIVPVFCCTEETVMIFYSKPVYSYFKAQMALLYTNHERGI